MMIRRALVLFSAVLTVACNGRGGSEGGEVSAQGEDELDRAIAANPALRSAQQEIDGGHPWKATLALSPRLNSQKRDPATVLVAARAASEWGGWMEVEKLLSKEPWTDSLYGGAGEVLLARAALDRNGSAEAVEHAARALRHPTSSATVAARRVYLARALDRVEDADSSASLYVAAASGLPAVGDWLRLRAAGATKDADERSRLYARVSSGVARSRIPWTEAQARERFGDIPGAIERYSALKARLITLRLRMTAARDSAGKAALKDSVIAFLRSSPSRDDTRQAVQLLDNAQVALTPADELVMARALASPGPLARALTGFERANRAGILRPDDRLQYALALSRAGRNTAALALLDSIQEPSGTAARAAYQRARLVMTASGASSAMPALRSVADRFATETETASAALYLLADLQTDAGADADAGKTYRELYSRYPSASRADDARFRAAVIDLVAGHTRAAAAGFDSITKLFPNSNERNAARYWAARAWLAAGDRKRAEAGWQAILTEDPATYYGIVSARRLRKPVWKPASAADKFTSFPAIDSAFRRADLLEKLGMDTEAHFELDAIEDSAFASRDRALATANAFRAHGEGAVAIRIGNKLIEQGEKDARAYRLAYPVIDREELQRNATANKLDAALVAGLIKQESAFFPRAVSVANARGLMQVLPSVGAEIAKALHYPVWSTSLLFDPDVNLQIGTNHLAAATRQYDDIVRVLAAYNAGAARVERWSKKNTTGDIELFAEQIPFVETRDYVRVVQRNAEIYRALYGLK
jgi:soluble lytic murein transglycosylase